MNLSTRLEVHCLIYTDFCRSYTKEINSAKSVYYKSLIANSDEKQLFQVIDRLFMQCKTCPCVTNSHVSAVSHGGIQQLLLYQDTETQV